MNGDGLDKLKQSTSSKTIALLINKFDSEPSTERNAASEKQKKKQAIKCLILKFKSFSQKR